MGLFKLALGVAGFVVMGTGAVLAQTQATPAIPLTPIGGAPKPLFADVPASHKQVLEVKVRSTDGKHALQTISIDSDGRALALTAPPKSFGPPVKGATSEVHVFSPVGKSENVLKVDFHANSVAGGPDGSVYVAGDGKVARFDRAGKQIATIELPHIKSLLADDGGIRKKAEAQLKAQRDNFLRSVTQFKDRLKAIEDKKEEDRTDLEKRQLPQFRQILKSYEQTEKFYANMSVDTIIGQMTSRVRTINAITLSSKDIFIACGDPQGYGYAIWRMDHSFANPKQVLAGIGGCCGQMDIQTAGLDLLVAENTKHRFAKYDRDGKTLGAFGKRGTGNELECFGGCCNPMNICGTSNGDVFTAESEGVIKRFSSKGDFLGVVAAAKMTGGCKNVAFAVSRDEQRIYFLDLPGSRFLVFAKQAEGK